MTHTDAVLASIQFRNFKALRAAALELQPFNLLLGPSGSGKTSLIEALLRLRSLAGLPAVSAASLAGGQAAAPQIVFRFRAPWDRIKVTVGCAPDELVCNALAVEHPPGPDGEARWEELRARLRTIRAHLFDHYAMAAPARRADGAELATNAGNLAAVLAGWQEREPAAFAGLTAEFTRLMPEFGGLGLRAAGEGHVELTASLAGNGHDVIPAANLSQGTLYLLATLVLAFHPRPPAVVCLEEADRGVHPRMLREVRDALYRLSYPRDFGLERAPVQVVTTTHSPYLLDQFKEHPEEVVLAHKHGNRATFQRLSERTDLVDLLRDSHLGDLWYSGILGGVPGEE